MHPHIKRVLEGLLARGGPAWVAKHLSVRTSVVIAYHNIVPDDAPIEGDLSLHLPRSRFAEQLDRLAEMHEVVPLDSILEDCEARRLRVAITFDDAYRGAVTIGVEELVERGLPGTIFVAPGLLGGRSFWWDALADPPPNGLPQEVRRLALEELCGRDSAVREWALRNGRSERPVGYHLQPATVQELLSAAGRPGITLASHTWNHPNLALLEPAELQSELSRPLHWLRERFSGVIDWLSYPYGLTSPVVEKAAAASGYRAAVRVDGGRLRRRRLNPHSIPRINVAAQLTPDGLMLRTAGLVS